MATEAKAKRTNCTFREDLIRMAKEIAAAEDKFIHEIVEELLEKPLMARWKRVRERALAEK